MKDSVAKKHALHPILERVVMEDLLSREVAEEICEASRRNNPLLGEVLLGAKILRMGQLMKVLGRQADDPSLRFGEVAVELGFCTEADIRWALGQQAERCRHPLEELYGRGLVSQGALLQFLIGMIKRSEKLSSEGFSSVAFPSERQSKSA